MGKAVTTSAKNTGGYSGYIFSFKIISVTTVTTKGLSLRFISIIYIYNKYKELTQLCLQEFVTTFSGYCGYVYD